MNVASLDLFKTKVPFAFESEGYIVKTASGLDDLKLALQLRHKVFLEEGLNRTHETGLEFDDFDHRADHLMIIDKNLNEAVGTYRLIHSNFSNIFYSQGEFHLDSFLSLEGPKLEMGRACTHTDFRTGRTMDLLWQGLAHYIIATKTRYLFGCSSVDSTDPKVVFTVARSLLENGGLSFDFDIHPIGQYNFKNAQSHLDTASVDGRILRILPPLLRSYLHAGSKVYGFPALDKDFQCSDMLTILDLRNLNSKFAERYNIPFG